MKVVATMSVEEFIEEFPHAILFSFDWRTGSQEGDHTRLMDSVASVDELDRYSDTVLDFTPLLPGPHTNREFPRKMLIGRDDGRDFVIHHETVSKRHACILHEPERDGFVLMDSGSTNGTMSRGQVVQPGEQVELHDGDVVTFGDVSFLFFSPRGAYLYMQQYRMRQESRK
jgi:hypothetical protein